jgi:hypothetical protein
VRQQHPLCADPTLEPCLALLGEAPIAGELTSSHRLLDVRELVAGEIWAIEGNHGVGDIDD